MEVLQEKGSVVALGNFDGLHIGHMAVINAASEMAKRLGSKLVIATFTEHPMKYLTGESPKELLMGKVKEDAFSSTGAEICNLDFLSLKDMEPEKFFEEVLLSMLNAKGVCCGFNYSFGAKGKGTPELLQSLCEKKGIEFFMAPATILDSEPVSSTRIRKAIFEGDIELANRMLGRPYSYDRLVVDGDKRGRSMGIPTINQLLPENMAVPKFGVYESTTTVDGKEYASLTNIGVRPTIGTGYVSSETFIIDFSGDLYGKHITVSLLRFMRPEKKFDSIEELYAQINADVAAVKSRKK